jgi:hypothetical protein
MARSASRCRVRIRGRAAFVTHEVVVVLSPDEARDVAGACELAAEDQWLSHEVESSRRLEAAAKRIRAALAANPAVK